ncbi:MAG: hypothetical protein WAM04_12385 [Candidatus Sulfotelmatobacter sp.]
MRAVQWFVFGVVALLIASHAFSQEHSKKSYLNKAVISQNGDTVHIFANAPRPLVQVLDALGKKYWWKVSYEDPRYTSDLDLVDDIDPQYLEAHPGARAPIPGGGAFSVDFPSGPTPGKPPEEYSTLQAVVDAYNHSGNPGRFELRRDDKGNFDVVGIAAYDKSGDLVQQEPLLDVAITFVPQERNAWDAIDLIRQALAQRTGTPVGNLSWLNQFMRQVTVTVGGKGEPARTVLWRTLSTISSNDGDLRWRLFYDPQLARYWLNVE